ncbi:MAG: hypothetical protein LLG04_16245 [Parachlamydia sp.]|nr:hypothetical protein [Parachlamydia sp.]
MRRNLWNGLFLLILILSSPPAVAGFNLNTIRKWIMPQKRLREYERFFSPILFLPYRAQLQACISETLSQEPELAAKLNDDSPFFLNVKKLLVLSQESPPAHPKSHRDWHQRWLGQLRQVLSSKELLTKKYDKAIEGAKHLLDTICLFMFSEAEFFDNISELLALELKLVFPTEKLTTEELPDMLEKTWKKLSRHDSVSGFKKQSKEPGEPTYDPHFGGILPTRLFCVGSTHLIYMPRVTQEYKNEDATISPEYLRYLQALASKEKQHLYINLMDRTDSHEKPLSSKIEGLERKQKSLHVITLDYNSSFYKQRYKNLDKAEDFKTAFIKQFFAPNAKCYFYWSHALDKRQWRLECEKTIDIVHSDYFQNKEILSTDERKAFIDITYIALIRSLLQRYHHANITCKHAMDRAPQLISLLFADEIVRTESTWSPENVAKFLAIVLAPPLLSHNRPSTGRHIKRISNTLRHLR